LKTTGWAVLLVLLCTAFTSAGQILYKIASKTLSPSLDSVITNVPLILGLISYFIGAVILIIALKNGELSVLYPFISTGFIWVSLLSIKFLGETMTFQKWAGVAVIFSGITLIGIGSRKGNENNKRAVKK
jgi:multidrug transporter EmrE-like cation transporter